MRQEWIDWDRGKKYKYRETEPKRQAEKGKEAGGSEDERESGYDSIDPLRDVNATELRRDGANRCNMGDGNAIKHEDWRWGERQERAERERRW